MILGVQAGMAIENARLYESEQRARHLAERRREGMRRLARQVVMAQENERQNIARELHDETGQALTSFKISLGLIRSSLPTEMQSVREELTALIELADSTMGNLRLLAHNLRPPGLDTFGLDVSLAGLCQDFSGFTKIPVQYQGTSLPELALLTSLSLYRFVQEALTNAAKHARATQIEVQLSCDAENVLVSVADNGEGFNPPSDLESAEDLRGAGLRGMYERLNMVSGHLDIHSAPGQGTRLIALVPLREGT
jgi:signal transduction histidine kinase